MREVGNTIVGKAGHARLRLKHEAPFPGDLFLDLVEEHSLVHADHLTAILLEHPLRLDVYLGFLLKIFPECRVNPLLELRGSFPRREKLLFDERSDQPGGGPVEFLILGEHPR